MKIICRNAVKQLEVICVKGQMEIFDFIEKPQTQFEQIFEKVNEPVMLCANCLCQYCANNVEEIWDKVKPEETQESCFNCDECRTFTGQAEHREHLLENCNKFVLSEYGAGRNRKKFKVIKGGKSGSEGL